MESLTEENSEQMRFCDEGVEWTDLWQVTDSLWQWIFCKKQRNERKGVGFYRCNARKTKRRFDPRYKPINERHMSNALNASGQLVRPPYPWQPHTPWTVIQGSSSPLARDFRPSPCWLWHRPLSIYSRHLS